jgi:flagellin
MSRINTNIPSIRATHQLAANNADLQTRLTRLSTGLRINSGKDDPAGLIASETLRSETRAIGQAIDNSTRAGNVLATAEGSLNEISSLLLDMRALITHAANAGANSTDEVKADQMQVDSIIESIDRIANTTQFGGQKLINGNYAYSLSGVAASSIAGVTVFGARVPRNASSTVAVEVTHSAATAKVAFAGSAATGHNITLEIGGKTGTQVITLTSGSNANTITTAINRISNDTGVSATVSGTGANARIVLNSQTYGKDALVSVKAIDGALDLGSGNTLGVAQSLQTKGVNATVLVNGQTASMDGLRASIRANGLDLSVDLTADRATHLGTSAFEITGGGALFQIGPEVNTSGQVSIGLPSVGSTNLGNATVGFLNTISTVGTRSLIGGNASQAEQIVVEAINQVAVIRGRIGGLQKNQIETNINSQKVALENVQAAESAIRDADVATEVAAMTRAQILVQSTTSVLSMANQLPQTALSLIKGG